MNTIDKISLEIENNPKIKRYKELELIINNDSLIKKILDESKTIQKEIVHAEKLNKLEQLKVLNNHYDEKMAELYEIPLLMEYLDLQNEINEFLQTTTDNLNKLLMLDLSHKTLK